MIFSTDVAVVLAILTTTFLTTSTYSFIQLYGERIRRQPCEISLPAITSSLNKSSDINNEGEASTKISNNIDFNSESQTVAIIGAGVGGLAVASRIKNELGPSTKVIILEKNSKDKVGGRCGSWSIENDLGTFRFERGPSLLLLKDVYLDLFKDCRKDPKDFNLEIEQCYPAYNVVFEDGDVIQLGFSKKSLNENMKKLEAASRQKMDAYEENGAERWDEYMRCTAAFLDCGLPNFIEEELDLKSFPSFITEAVRDGFKSWPLKPHSDVLDATFTSDKMKALASFQDLYVGLAPFRNDNQIFGGILRKTSPAVFGLLAAIELHPTNDKAGVFAPMGGFKAVSLAFENLALELGVEIHYNKNVVGITEKGVSYSDVDDHKCHFLPADQIIVNADLPYAKTLLQKNDDTNNKKKQPQMQLKAHYDWDDSFDFSSGVIAFYWAVDKECHSLNTHNVFLVSSDRSKMERSWSVVRDNDPAEESFEDADYPFNFYVHRAAVSDKSATPHGCDSLMILVPCCTLRRDKNLASRDRDECIGGYREQFDDIFVAQVRQRVFDRLGVLDDLRDIRAHIIDEVVDTPADFADYYNLGAGTPFGLSHGFSQLSVTRPPQQSSQKNLLFVGASTRPGNGVPLVLLGAKAVAKKVVQKMKS